MRKLPLIFPLLLEACGGCGSSAEDAETPEEVVLPTHPRTGGVPLDLMVSSGREGARNSIRACTADENKQLQRMKGLMDQVVKENRLPGVDKTPEVACGPSMRLGSEYVYGAVLDAEKPQIAVDPDVFFDMQNLGCGDAAALYALYGCQEHGDCIAYDGPKTPFLPDRAREAATTFLQACGPATVLKPEEVMGFSGKGAYALPSGAVVSGMFHGGTVSPGTYTNNGASLHADLDLEPSGTSITVRPFGPATIDLSGKQLEAAFNADKSGTVDYTTPAKLHSGKRVTELSPFTDSNGWYAWLPGKNPKESCSPALNSYTLDPVKLELSVKQEARKSTRTDCK